MVRTPNTSDTLIQTRHGLPDPSQLLPARFLEQRNLREDLLFLHIADADGLFAAVDVVAFNYWVLFWPWGYADFYLWVCGGEGGEGVFEE